MKYMIVWSIAPENIKMCKEWWREPEPFAGFKSHQRWNEVGTAKGFTLIETDDIAALSRYNDYWADLVDLKIVPVVSDEEAAEIFTE